MTTPAISFQQSELRMAYNLGIEAARHGRLESDNPFVREDDIDLRLHWIDGWMDERNGGRQYDLFADEPPRCPSDWGLCE